MMAAIGNTSQNIGNLCRDHGIQKPAVLSFALYDDFGFLDSCVERPT